MSKLDINNNKIKINIDYLQKINNTDCLKYFGDWQNHIEDLYYQFSNGKPFENLIIDNFLNETYLEKLYDLFPKSYDTWHKYENPIEVKYTYDNINSLPDEIKDYFYILSSDVILNLFKKITKIENLEYDEYLHGAGLHCHPNNGRLNIHLDYEKHPFTGKERRLNIILFLSKDWKSEWNGSNELWDSNVSKCIKKTDVKYNRAIIFKTNDISWHGLPEIIKCPENVYRKTLAYYYVSELSNKNKKKYRNKANYTKKPDDEYNENMEKLYKIRENRRITLNDMASYFPNWKIDT